MRAHDPSNLGESQSATHWSHEWYCRRCDADTSFAERMNGACGSCGHRPAYYGMIGAHRESRYLFNGKTWVTQKCYNREQGYPHLTLSENVNSIKKLLLYAEAYNRPLFILSCIFSFAVAVFLVL